MKILILAVMFWVELLSAQQPVLSNKGASPIETKADQSNSGTTYAVVVGISDYQDPGIPDLRFADKDAEAFANFLRSVAGGKLDRDHLKILLNKEATMAQFAIALDWLWENVKEGDQAIIYFSGHGDVEKKSLTQPGFLLCWDAPERVYMAGGAFALPMLQEVISTLSIQNKAKVIVITDACRSGKLAGNSVGGAQATASNLSKQFANEIKILSCQPNEYSIEGEQWGGGRGAFSFNLVNALYGLADANKDLSITLQEIGRYLEDHVTAEVAPVSQLPMVLGNRNEKVATVNPGILATIQSGKTNQSAMLSSIDSRGIEEEVLAGLDTTTRELYVLFKKAIADKNFLKPANACADFYYLSLISNTKMQRLHSTITRNYAAALQDDAQQTLNFWLKLKQNSVIEFIAPNRLPKKLFTERVILISQCLERAAELLGSKHYMYADLKARMCFFEGYILTNSDKNPDKELGERALALFRQSLIWRPDQPHVYWQMSNVYGWRLLQQDSMEYYAIKAAEVYPDWTNPIINAGYILAYKYKQLDRALLFLERANKQEPNNVEVLNLWAIINVGQNNFAEAERQLIKATTIDSTNYVFWNNLGHLYQRTNRYEDAEMALKKGIAFDSLDANLKDNLGSLYTDIGRFWEAEESLKESLALDSINTSALNNMGTLYFRTNRFGEAVLFFKKIIALDSTFRAAWSNLGSCYLSLNRFAEAAVVLKKAITLDSMDASTCNSLGVLYLKTMHYAESEQILKRAILLDSILPNPRKHLGMVCFKTKRPEAARQNFLKAITLNPNYAGAMLGMAYTLQAEGKTAEAPEKSGQAFDYVEQAISKGSTFEQLENDEDLAPLRSTPEWNTLMKKHFPDKIKE